MSPLNRESCKKKKKKVNEALAQESPSLSGSPASPLPVAVRYPSLYCAVCSVGMNGVCMYARLCVCMHVCPCMHACILANHGDQNRCHRQIHVNTHIYIYAHIYINIYFIFAVFVLFVPILVICAFTF